MSGFETTPGPVLEMQLDAKTFLEVETYELSRRVVRLKVVKAR